MSNDLKSIQLLLYRLITAPNGVAQALADRPEDIVELNELIRGDDRLSASERVEIYANAYFYRILDCLKEDFPATLSVLGPDHFHNLITGYLIAYPPTEPSIFYAGTYLADYLRDHPIRQRWPFIAELARLERAIVESFHAADERPLSEDVMRAIAPGAWPALKMRAHPSIRIVDCEWRVDHLLPGTEVSRETDDADAGDEREPRAPLRERVSVLVWRQDARVSHRALVRAERAALRLAALGASFAEMCEAASGESSGGDPVMLINRLLARWLADGLLVLTQE
jgi:Putative DNA-binding domain